MSERLTAAIERLAAAPVELAYRLKRPSSIDRVARFPMSWRPPPTAERLAHISLKMANFLKRRGAPPEGSILDDVPFVLSNSQTTFVREERFRKALSEHLGREDQPRALLRLIDAYFESDEDMAPILGALIEPHLARHHDMVEFARRAALGLFQPTRLAEELTSKIIANGGNVDRVLAEFGSEFRDGSSPLAARALAAIPGKLVEQFSNGKFDRVQIITSSLQQLSERGVFLQDDTPGLVRSLLNPYRTDRRPQNPAALHAAAVELLGDPLTEPTNWATVDPELQRLVVAWSPRQLVELAFTLTREMDELSDWKSKFWLGLVGQGVIEEATLILAGPLADQLRRDPQNHQLSPFVASARASIYSTAILLMRAGGVTIGEWAPGGACRVWFDGNTGAPNLRQHLYDIWQTRASVDHEQAHRGSKKGTWQREMIFVLRAEGINIPDPEALL